jgi:hypothetical protein
MLKAEPFGFSCQIIDMMGPQPEEPFTWNDI